MDRGRLSIISCDAGRPFAARLVETLRNDAFHRQTGSPESYIRASSEVWFANGEVKTEIQENIRGDDVYVIQSIYEPMSRRSVNDNVMALLTAANAAWQSDAETVTIVVPLFPYARQERKRGREPVTAGQMAHFFEISGAHRVLTMDIHAEAIVGCFRKAKFENLHAARVLADYVKDELALENFVVVSPDAGGAHRARFFAKLFSTEFALIDKVRDYSKPGTVVDMRLVGNVEGRNAIVVDDMIDTGGSIIRAVETLKKKGAGDIHVCCTHPLLNGDAVKNLKAAYEDGLIRSVIAADSVMWGEQLADEGWYREVSVAHLFAQVIRRVNRKLSVSELLR